MNPVMYIVMAHPYTTPMSPGKLAAQSGHAAVEAYRLSCKGEGGNFQESSIANRWRRGGHYTKIVLMDFDLPTALEYIRARGFKAALIIDEGRTEFDNRLTPTAIGVEVVDKDRAHVRETFDAFKLYRRAPQRPEPDKLTEHVSVLRRLADSVKRRNRQIHGR